MASNYNVCARGRDKECTERRQRYRGREGGETNESCHSHNMCGSSAYFSKSFLPHMSLLLELQLEIVCSNESFWRALPLPFSCLPLATTTAFNLFNKIFALPAAAAAAPSMLSNVPNKIERGRDSDKMSKKRQAEYCMQQRRDGEGDLYSVHAA